MKTAFCFFGLSRCLEISYIFNKFYILDPLNCDVFIHTWDIDHGGTRFQKHLQQDMVAPSCHSTTKENFITNTIQPKSCVIENYDSFSNIWGTGSCAAMTYSISKVNDLRKQYEIDNNFVYDLVINARMDSLLKEGIPSTEILLKDEMVHTACNAAPESYDPSLPYGDMFAFGSSNLMDKYGKCFETWKGFQHPACEFSIYKCAKDNLFKLSASKIRLFNMEIYSNDEWAATRRPYAGWISWKDWKTK